MSLRSGLGHGVLTVRLIFVEEKQISRGKKSFLFIN